MKPKHNSPEEFMAWHRETYPDRHQKYTKGKRATVQARNRHGQFMKTRRR